MWRVTPGWMKWQLDHWQQEALELNGKEREVRQELEQMVTEHLPVGVGALSWITLQLEVRGWERFQNRRQVASYTGLCPGIHSSNGRGREGRINRCGNTIVRYTLIEMVWRLIRWQPDYPPIKKLRNALLSKRGKRRLVVAAARRLAIDLWRLATGWATAQELGLQLSNPMTPKSTT
jgi:transposase